MPLFRPPILNRPDYPMPSEIEDRPQSTSLPPVITTQPLPRTTDGDTTSTTPTTGPTKVPSGLSAVRQRIWDNFHSPLNKNPIRDPTEVDYQYWEQPRVLALENYDQRMFDREGEGSNAGHFPATPAATPAATQGAGPVPTVDGRSMGDTLLDLAMRPSGAQDAGGRGLSYASQPTRGYSPAIQWSLMDLANLKL